MTAAITGGCLCGAVRYHADAEPGYSVKCYCTDCRRTSGTGHAAAVGVPKNTLTVEGTLTHYSRKADSGREVTRSFCPGCGAGVYTVLEVAPDMVFLRASTLDDVSLFRPEVAFYASRAPSWDPVDAGLPAHATMPPRNA